MIVKAVQFKKLDEQKLIEFLSKNDSVQLVPLKHYCGLRHVLHSVNQTLKAFSQGKNISKKKNVEFLLRFYGETQIKKVLKKNVLSDECIFVSFDGSELPFEFKEIEFPKVDSEIEKKAMEKTGVFSLSI